MGIPNASTSRLGCTGLTGAFIVAAQRYWLSVWPTLIDEINYWQARAARIPDPQLRYLALQAHAHKRGNIEGSAAFAAFAPRRWRKQVVRAQVTFQAIYDYVDSLSEQPSSHPVQNSRQLHTALTAAIDPSPKDGGYYAHQTHQQDGGYLDDLIHTCRTALSQLPSLNITLDSTRRLTSRIATYQSLNLDEHHGGHRLLRRWATRATPQNTSVFWWETAASAGSSLGVFALMMMAASAHLQLHDAAAVERAYFPWVGALHSLLDSVVDQHEDQVANQRSLLSYYRSPNRAAARLGQLTDQSLQHLTELPNHPAHVMVLTAMAAHYLSSTVEQNTTGPLHEQVLAKLGGIANPTIRIVRARDRIKLITQAALRHPHSKHRAQAKPPHSPAN